MEHDDAHHGHRCASWSPALERRCRPLVAARLKPEFRELVKAPFKLKCNQIFGEGRRGSWETISINRRKLKDVGAEKLAAAITSGALAGCTTLYLNGNQIGDVGCKALAEALTRGAMKVTRLYLNENDIRNDGLTALATACANGALPHIEWLDLGDNLFEDGGLR